MQSLILFYYGLFSKTN
jgi:hypothetical protein